MVPKYALTDRNQPSASYSGNVERRGVAVYPTFSIPLQPYYSDETAMQPL